MTGRPEIQEILKTRCAERRIYGSNLAEFEGRFLGAIEKRTFEQRTMRYEDVRDIMEDARPAILEKAQKMGR